MTLKEIAERIGGTLKGDGNLSITGVNSIEDAGAGQITFLTDAKYLDRLNASGASAVIVRQEIATGKAQVIHPNPALAFARLVAHFHPLRRPAPGIDPRAAVAASARIGENVSIGACAVVGERAQIGDHSALHPGVVVGEDCRIGDHCTLHPQVTLYPGVVLGNNVIVHAGAVIGADGFGYTPDESGRHFKIHQIGTVVIEDDVEIGANSCIDRAALSVTRVKAGTKIDNLVQIGHNCIIGEHSILVAQSGISGSCTLGHHVIVGGQAGVSDHLTLGDHVSLMARSGVMRDIESNSIHGGSPSLPRLEYGKTVALTLQLPKLLERVRELEKRLGEIEKRKPSS